jgi:predicted O-methyltransferase YrrM
MILKKEVLTDLPIIPEEYDIDHYNSRKTYPFSEMVDAERRFLHGLIRYYEPKNLIELGVSRGGSTVNILNSILDKPESSLVGIDLAEVYYGDKKTPIGQVAKDTFPDLPKGKWRLFTGKDPVDVIENLDTKFDFAIIDTGHVMPVELMNFLTVLPFLEDGAIVVMHDISSFFQFNQEKFIAPRVLLSVLCAPKIFPKSYGFLFENSEIPNIAAFQITPDTRKYIGNVFDALMLRWDITLTEQSINTFSDFFRRHYGGNAADGFANTAKMQLLTGNDVWVKIADFLSDGEFVIYGIGAFGRRALSELERFGKIPLCAVDNYAETGERTFGNSVIEIKRPTEVLKNGNIKILVCVYDTINVFRELDELGYKYKTDYMRLTDFYNYQG